MQREISLGAIIAMAAESGELTAAESGQASAPASSSHDIAAPAGKPSRNIAADKRQQQQRAFTSVICFGLIGLFMTAAAIAGALALKRAHMLPRYASSQIDGAAYGEWLVDSVPAWVVDSTSALRLRVHAGVASSRT